MPNPDMEELDRKVGRPIASYSLEDLRRLFLRGAPVPDLAPGAMPADVNAMVPAPVTDALRGPPMPAPVASGPLPTLSPEARQLLSRGTPPEPVMPPPPAPAAVAASRLRPVMPPPPAPPVAMGPPVPLTDPNRVDPRVLARALMRLAPPTGAEVPLSPGAEMQVGPAPLGGMPVQAQADQRMFSVSRVDPNSFQQRFRRTMRGE